METSTQTDRARRLITAATGEEYGDGYIVTDLGVGISEPGYGDEKTVWVTGNWNPKRWWKENEPPLTLEESLPARLGEALHKYAEAEILWLDEWITCQTCFHVFRIEADSYSWEMFGVLFEDGPICGNCLEWSDLEETYANNPRMAVPRFIDLEAEGFVKHNGQYSNGWYPGQDDNPTAIFEALKADGWTEVVFKLDYVGMFDLGFSAWVRERTN